MTAVICSSAALIGRLQDSNTYVYSHKVVSDQHKTMMLWLNSCMNKKSIFGYVSSSYLHKELIMVWLTADFSSVDLLTAFSMMLLFCWYVQHKLLIGFHDEAGSPVGAKGGIRNIIDVDGQ